MIPDGRIDTQQSDLALAPGAGGPCCRVVCRPRHADRRDTHTVSRSIRPSVSAAARSVLSDHIREFQPDWVLVSSEDLSHVLLREAHQRPRAVWCISPTRRSGIHSVRQAGITDAQATAIVRNAAGVVAISHAMAAYIKQHCGATATVIHPPMYGDATLSALRLV